MSRSGKVRAGPRAVRLLANDSRQDILLAGTSMARLWTIALVKILSRYLFFSVLGHSLAGVALFVFVLLVGNILRDVVNNFEEGRIGWDLFLRLLVLLIPYAISFALPLGMLIGTLLVLGRLSSHNEIVAMKASGYSLWRLALPILLLALLASLWCLQINLYQAPAARREYRAILGDLVRLDPIRVITPRTFIRDFKGYVLFVGAREGDTLRQLWIWQLAPNGDVERIIRAEESTIAYDPERDAILLHLRRSTVEGRTQDRPDRWKNLRTIAVEELPLVYYLEESLGPRGAMQRRTAHLTWPELRGKLVALQQIGPAASPAQVQEMAALSYHIQRRLADALAVFSLVFMGIPIGIKASRAETFANIALALALALGYYLLSIFVDWQQNRPEWHPALLAWLPNALCLGLGLVLLVRANRH